MLADLADWVNLDPIWFSLDRRLGFGRDLGLYDAKVHSAKIDCGRRLPDAADRIDRDLCQIVRGV